MQSYFGNEKPYVYICYGKEDENVNEVLNALEERNIACCISNDFNSKETERIAKAYGVLFFITDELLRNKSFRKIVETAVKYEKNILCIYPEDLPLESSLAMQLNSQQAIFRSKYQDKKDYLEEVLKAQIFHDMKITTEQKKSQRNRALLLSAAALMALLLLFVTVVKPLLKTPVEEPQVDENLSLFGLDGLSDEDLHKVLYLCIIGDQVFGTKNLDRVDTMSNGEEYFYEIWRSIGGPNTEISDQGVINKGTISDLSILYKMPNLVKLIIVGENIEDLTPIGELSKLEYLNICYNPFTDLSPLSNCKALTRLDIRYTGTEDLSPVFSLNNLKSIFAQDCHNLRSIEGFERSNIDNLDISNTAVNEIPHLRKTFFCSYNFNGLDIDDYSFFKDCKFYCALSLTAEPYELNDYLSNATIEFMNLTSHELKAIDELDFFISDSLNIWAENLESLENISKFKDIRTLNILVASNLHDLSPLKELRFLKELNLRNCPGIVSVKGLEECPYLDSLTLEDVYNVEDLELLLDSNIRELTIEKELLPQISTWFRKKGITVYYIDRDNGYEIKEYNYNF